VLTILKLLVNLIVFGFLVTPVYAVNPPSLTSPTDKSTVPNSTLTWETVSEASQYRVIVDDEETITSPFVKNYYSTKNQYSPKLEEKTYYWKVAARDSSDTWSEFSPIWSFTLNSTTGESDSSQDTKAATLFESSNIPTEINSDTNFKASIKLETDKPNTKYFLKGAFKKSDGSNYFGETKMNSDWVKNGSSFSSQVSITTDASGMWIGDLEVKPDSEDSGFEGSNEYIFKVAKYSDTGTLSWSNETKIKINQVEVKPSPFPSTAQSLSPKPTPIPSPSEELETMVEFFESSIAGIATEEPKASSSPLIAGKTQNNPLNIFVILGLILIGLSIGFTLYFYIRNRREII